MKILHLTLKKKWFDMIASGEKPDEYREIKPYWIKRLLNRHYDAVQFRNGYSKKSPVYLCKLNGILQGIGNVKWGAPEGKNVFILKLGERIEL